MAKNKSGLPPLPPRASSENSTNDDDNILEQEGSSGARSLRFPHRLTNPRGEGERRSPAGPPLLQESKNTGNPKQARREQGPCHRAWRATNPSWRAATLSEIPSMRRKTLSVSLQRTTYGPLRGRELGPGGWAHGSLRGRDPVPGGWADPGPLRLSPHRGEQEGSSGARSLRFPRRLSDPRGEGERRSPAVLSHASSFTAVLSSRPCVQFGARKAETTEQTQPSARPHHTTCHPKSRTLQLFRRPASRDAEGTRHQKFSCPSEASLENFVARPAHPAGGLASCDFFRPLFGRSKRGHPRQPKGKRSRTRPKRPPEAPRTLRRQPRPTPSPGSAACRCSMLCARGRAPPRARAYRTTTSFCVVAKPCAPRIRTK